jgi:hypothetical protein
MDLESILSPLALGLGTVIGLVLGLAVGFILWGRKQAVDHKPTAPPPPPKPSAEPLRLIALLQREGRLVDFLLEDLEGIPDAQVGAGVREVHRKCRKLLQEHLVLEPVMGQNEGDQATVPAGFDPSEVRLTGNVTGQPPFTGTLQHRGWRVKEIRLAKPPAGQDEFVIMPAEVELA